MHGIQSQCIVLSTVAPSVAINLFFLTGVKLFSHFTLLQALISLTSSQYIYLDIRSFLEMVKLALLRWDLRFQCMLHGRGELQKGGVFMLVIGHVLLFS